MADQDLIVNVNVSKTTAAVTRAGFGTPLGVFQVAVGVQAERQKTYASVSEMTSAGFPTTDRAVAWATTVFAQDPAPSRVAIGRRVPGTAQVDTVTITTADAGTWSITIDTVVFSYVAGALDTEQDIAVALAAAVNAGLVPVTASTPVAGVFTVTADIAGEAFVNGGIVVPGAGAGTFVNTTPNGAAEAMATALTAIEAENPSGWYVTTIETRNDADLTALATFIAAASPPKVAWGQSRDPDIFTGTPGNIAAVLAATSNRKMALIAKKDDGHYADAAAAGIMAAADLDGENGAITMHGKQLVTVPTDDLTSAEILAAAGDVAVNDAGEGANVYIEIGGRGFLFQGRSVEGEFIDVQTTLDWTQARVKEAIFAPIATTPTKVPFTNAGIATVENEGKGVMFDGVSNGHFSPDEEITSSVPAVSDVSTADKNARYLRNVIFGATLAGAIHGADVQVNVSA